MQSSQNDFSTKLSMNGVCVWGGGGGVYECGGGGGGGCWNSFAAVSGSGIKMTVIAAR